MFLPLPFILFSIIIYLYFSDLTLLPSDEKSLSFSTYDDRVENGGNSTVDNYSVGHIVSSVNFTLKKGYAYPFAGCQFRIDSSGHFLNLNPYKWMILELDSITNASNIHIILKENIENFTTKAPLSERFHTYDLITEPNRTRYKIPVDEFICPFWWYAQNVKSNQKIPEPSKSRISGINFQSGSMLLLNMPYTISIQKIQFRKYPLLQLITFSISGLYYILFIIIFFIRKKSAPNTRLLHHEPLNIPNQSSENLNMVIKYIGSHYMDMDLSIQIVSKETGIASEKIARIIKEYCAMTFRQYLNNIRIAEAKRLLLESDRQIIDIAMAVGYNTVNHFNKVFKLLVNCSPKEVRK